MRALWLLVLVVLVAGCGDDDGDDRSGPRRDAAKAAATDAPAGPVQALHSCLVDERLFPMKLEGSSGIARSADVRVLGVISASPASGDARSDPLALFEVTSGAGEAKRAAAEAKRRGLEDPRAVGPVWYQHKGNWTPAAQAAVQRCLRSLR